MLVPLVALVLAGVPSPQARGNTALYRPQGPVYSVAASIRSGVLLGDGRRVIQPAGFGAGLQFRVHAGRLGPVRFGGEIQLGHLHFLEKRFVPAPDGSNARRYAALGHTEFALGPSIQILMGPVFAELGAAVGVGISQFVRPLEATDEQDVTDTTAMIRGGGHLGVPIRNNSSVIFGVAAQKYFSKQKIVARPDPAEPLAPADVTPFDLALEIMVGYHFSF